MADGYRLSSVNRGRRGALKKTPAPARGEPVLIAFAPRLMLGQGRDEFRVGAVAKFLMWGMPIPTGPVSTSKVILLDWEAAAVPPLEPVVVGLGLLPIGIPVTGNGKTGF